MIFETFDVRGKKYPLFFNGTARFDLEELYGENLMDSINPATKDGFLSLAYSASKLNEQARAAAKWSGTDCENERLEAEMLVDSLDWPEIQKLYESVFRAVMAGLGRKVPDHKGKVDVILLEQEKKTVKG